MSCRIAVEAAWGPSGLGGFSILLRASARTGGFNGLVLGCRLTSRLLWEEVRGSGVVTVMQGNDIVISVRSGVGGLPPLWWRPVLRHLSGVGCRGSLVRLYFILH